MSLFVVTGGAGFIGSHLTARLSKGGQQVRVLDNLQSAASELRAAALAEMPGVEIVEGDIRDAGVCQKAIWGAEFVLHHAAEVSVPQSIEDPAACVAVNLGGLVNVLDAARSQTVRRFVFASSCAVYGDTPGAEKSEGSPTDPRSPYAVSKLAGEHLCRAYFLLHSLETISLRYFNVYGPDQDPNGAYAAVVPKFITAILQNQKPIVYGDGEQSRDFVFVEDIVDANLRAVAAGPDALGKSFNIGSGRSVTLNQILQQLAQQTDRVLALDRRPARAGDIRTSRAAVAAAANLLEFSPNVALEDGLARTLHWYQSRSVSNLTETK